MADQAAEAKRVDIPQYPGISKPIITYKMVQELNCSQTHTFTLPTPIKTDALAGGVRRPTTVDEAIKAAGDASLGGENKQSEEVEQEIKYAWNKPRLMLIFDGGDINCAIHYLLSSLHDPFSGNAVATLLIQESLLEQFTDRVVTQLRALSPEVANHPVSVRTRALIEKFKAKTIMGDPDNVPAAVSPMLVCDFIHNYLGEGPTGIITMHTFRTPKEATEVYLKETVPYSSASIWNEKLASAYEIVALLKCDTFMINCFDANLEPIQNAFNSNHNDVKIFKGYHYETFVIKQTRKIVVFPVGTIFAN